MSRITLNNRPVSAYRTILAVLFACLALPNLAFAVSYDLVESGLASVVKWDSGNNSNLRYKYVKCFDDFGYERLLVKLEGYREPSSNADNFITQLTGVCRRYSPDTGAYPYTVADIPSLDNSKTLFTASHRNPELSTEVEVGNNGENIPVGVRLKVNNNYVKDIKIIYKKPYDYGLSGSEWTTPAMTGLSGSNAYLRCPFDYALSGVGVHYSTNNGKIRIFKAYCRLLVHH